MCVLNTIDEVKAKLNDCQRRYDESTYSGLESCIPNPTLIKYEPVEGKYRTTRVTINLSTPGIEGYEIIEELED